MRTLSEAFCKHIHGLLEKYKNELSKTYYKEQGLGAWTKLMIDAAHQDWKDEKLTDVEFAHLVDNILCY